ncbi:hypothetical protein CTM45_03600 [Prevotella intermedia]|uniref:Uncharacterized protein n=1 Tax=Prevotella intermedia TaxID=28131 RepID=A0A2D3LLZ9_PREIN|nr:hypothetical protein CTM46_07530 [Prevotella intermedia]PJI23455.1 hypothetical protein CTM45_03600 [Prevotella intermedia]
MFLPLWGLAKTSIKRQEFRYQIVTHRRKSKKGLRIEAKQLFHRFLFIIFHFSASLRNTCSSVPLQAKEI